MNILERCSAKCPVGALLAGINNPPVFSTLQLNQKNRYYNIERQVI